MPPCPHQWWNCQAWNGWLILPVTQLPCNHRVL
jgi:hypothetical protein